MSHRFLLPVTNNPELVMNKLKELDLEKTIIVNNFDNQDVELLCKQAEDKGATVFRYPRNLGLAASWNIGLKTIEKDNNNFVIFLSPSAVFDKSVNYFIEKIVDTEQKAGPQCRYIASGLATMHCFAHTRRCIELGGYFDENFWPIYFEDTDFGRRSRLNGVKEEVVLCSLNSVVHSKEYSISMKDKRLFRLFQMNAHRIQQYYIDKWGGVHCSETFNKPFNNPDLHVNDWSVDPLIFAWPPGVYEGDF